MSQPYLVALNFLELSPKSFSFKVFRRSHQGEKREGELANCHLNSFPDQSTTSTHENSNRSQYWWDWNPREGFTEFECKQDFNNDVTKRFIESIVLKSCRDKLDPNQFEVEDDRFIHRVNIFGRSYPEGKEVIWIEPYYLSSKRLFGVLIGFSFHQTPGIQYSRGIQQLSLSLDRNFKSNANFYYDKYEKIRSFINKSGDKLFNISFDGTNFSLNKSLTETDAETLDPKIFAFKDNSEKGSQYSGLKEFGPFRTIAQPAKYFFIYQAHDRELARDLFKALKGETFPGLFSGVEGFFRIPFSNDLIAGFEINDLNTTEIERIIQVVKSSGAKNPIIVSIYPREEQKYYLAKFLCIKNGIPLQRVTPDIISSKEKLKWSIANISLQLFSKMGGTPWRVVPRNEECLIVGIGQSHRKIEENGTFRIEKYYSYSILTDSSGIFIDLKVLGNSEQKQTYLEQLRSKLVELFKVHQSAFKKIVLHVPSKIKIDELVAIKSALDELHKGLGESLELVVLKINDDNKYFGFNQRSNSLVPFESTYFAISGKEFLVWFEGLQAHNPNVLKRFSGPTHIEFYWSSRELSLEEKKSYLQDAINLSGANWRGFNAKSHPVSMYYCNIIAKFLSKFKQEGLGDLDIESLNTWFL